MKAPLSAFGQKRTYSWFNAMSAKCHKQTSTPTIDWEEAEAALRGSSAKLLICLLSMTRQFNPEHRAVWLA